MEGGRQGCEEMKRGCVEAQEKPGTEREGKKETVFTVNFQFTFAQMCSLKPQEVLVGLTLLSSLCVCVVFSLFTLQHTDTITSEYSCCLGTVYPEPPACLSLLNRSCLQPPMVNKENKGSRLTEYC